MGVVGRHGGASDYLMGRGGDGDGGGDGGSDRQLRAACCSTVTMAKPARGRGMVSQRPPDRACSTAKGYQRGCMA